MMRPCHKWKQKRKKHRMVQKLSSELSGKYIIFLNSFQRQQHCAIRWLFYTPYHLIHFLFKKRHLLPFNLIFHAVNRFSTSQIISFIQLYCFTSVLARLLKKMRAYTIIFASVGIGLGVGAGVAKDLSVFKVQ